MTMSPGDKVTAVVFREQRLMVAVGVVHVANSLYFAAGIGTILNICDEGLVWIRGHHVGSSEEAQALAAAYALTRP